MKSNKKCVFNVNFQYLHKQVPTAYFSMMFNIHKHISHLIFLLIPEWGEYEIGKQKIILRSISREQPYFSDHFHP
jgi:3-hydroxymyristoyl/3-hydroxydecanoyl-(acyl carrier protein) dehydratase